MDVTLIIAAIVVAWIVVAVVVALIFGRTASAGEHEHRLTMFRREVRRETPKPDADAEAELSKRPRS